MDENINSAKLMKQTIVEGAESNNINTVNKISEDSEMVVDIQARVILHWNYRNLTNIPDEVFQYGIHLKELYLKRNCITKLPPQISQHENLSNLYLIGNQIESLPKEIGQLRSLKVLDLTQNNLEELPMSIIELNELRQLILTHNLIKALPPGLSRLKKLEYFELSGNRINMLPEDMFYGLESLRELSLDQNPIRYLPRSISRHRGIKSLSICRGKLRFLPAIPIRNFLCNENDDDNMYFRIDGNSYLNYLPIWMHQIFGPDLECFGCDLEVAENVSWSEREIIKQCPTDTSIRLSSLQVHFDGKPRTLHFDEDLCEISHVNETKPCSLLELCLRFIYKQIENPLHNWGTPNNKIFSTSHNGKIVFTQENDTLNFLPSSLTRLLTTGPVSKCFQCLSPIFTQAWLLIFGFHNQNVNNNPNPDLNANNIHHHQDQLGQRVSGNKIQLSVIYFCSSKCIQRMHNMESQESKYAYPELKVILENLVAVNR